MNWEAFAAVMAAIGVLIAAIGVVVSAVVSRQIHQESVTQNRRRELIPVWKEMLEISRINSLQPDPNDVRTALNLLALVAQCHNLEIVERNVLKEMFAKVYVAVYKDIDSISTPLTLGAHTKPGRDFLQDVPQIKRLYDDWSVV